MNWKISILLCLCCEIYVKCATIKKFYNIHINICDHDVTTVDISKQPKYIIEFPTEDPLIPSVKSTAIQENISPTTSMSMSTTISIPTRDNSLSEKFNAKLYEIMAKDFESANLIYSPISLRSLLTILYLGAEFTTATQLKNALELPDSLPILLQQFQSIMTKTNERRMSQNFHLNFAQKIYFKNDFVLLYGIKDIAKTFFGSEIAPLSFDSASTAAAEINNWVAKKTENRIGSIVESETFDTETELILVNVIYLKAKWEKEFSKVDTLKQNFFADSRQTQPILVDMMYTEEDFKYGNFPELDAKIIELPFRDSDVSMLIILPNELYGLASMENRLRTINLKNLLEKMEITPLTLRLPRFKIESDLDMQGPLQELGIRNIFNGEAELGKIFSNPNVKVSKIQHKAFIDVNEGGIEAAASTFVQLVPLSLQPDMEYFTVDHPFMFVIRSPETVIFIGHVINNFQ